MALPLSLLIKPAGPDCNLSCGHCFYLEKSALVPPGTRPRMTAGVLDGLLTNYLGLDQDTFAFCWQGGEPLLMGLPFYQQVVERQRDLARRGSVILNSVQTNGLLIDDGLAEHFAQWRFLVGISLDGPPRLHDEHRRTRDGGPTHAQVMAGIDRLRRLGVPVNVLCLISQVNVGQPQELYRYFSQLGLSDLQFIPLVDDQRQRSGRPLAITGSQWGEFLCGLFDAWWPHGVGRIAIRHFDAIAAKLVLAEDHLCTLGSDCRSYLVVDHEGSVYPCDFRVEPDLKLGNVMTDSLEAMRTSEAYRQFGRRKQDLPDACGRCPHLARCQGDCPVNRRPDGPSRLCDGWRQFFAHTEQRFDQLADLALARGLADQGRTGR